VKLRLALALLVGTLCSLAVVGVAGRATAGEAACAQGRGGYTYAGSQSTVVGHGVRAIITSTRTATVAAGHVAGWVGVGGPGEGPNGTDEWVQVGLASMPGLPSVLYAEITKPGRSPNFQVLEDEVPTGESRDVAVLEIANRPGWWRVWVSGNPATGPIHLRGSSDRWQPIATAESWNGGEATCNRFGFRFERVSVSYGGGGSWRPYVPGARFLDSGYRLHALAKAPALRGQYARRLTATESSSSSSSRPDPYAFVATSGS
jgi:hypothetical protein